MLKSIPVLRDVFCSASPSSSNDIRRELVGAADDVEADVVLEQRRELRAQIPLQQHHQRADFGGRPLPVLDRERIERQHLEAEPRRGLDHVAHGVDAGAMAFDPRQVALARPAAVAVHDDGDVAREPVGLELAARAPLRRLPQAPTPAADRGSWIGGSILLDRPAGGWRVAAGGAGVGRCGRAGRR